MEDYVFSMDMDVRDYECDLEGVVNNAVYMHYLEHARHQYIKTLGIDFAELAKNGINLIVIKAELEYKSSLTSGDKFTVKLRVVRESRLKIVFEQDIYRLDSGKTVLKGRVTTTAVNANGRPHIPESVEKALGI